MVAKNSRFASAEGFTQSSTGSLQQLDKYVYRKCVDRIIDLLNTGQIIEAIILANFSGRRSSIPASLAKTNFNPAEPRDAKGRWTKEGSDDASQLEPVQYRGHFHDFVVADLINGLNASGGKAIANVQVFGINGVLAIPDGASLPAGWNTPYFIEVKTGLDPPFTENQRQIYPLICLGGHAVSTDPRIIQLGLTPGKVLPPMDIMVVHTSGPGRPLTFVNYCEEIGLRGSK